MANNKATYQQLTNVSINRSKLLDIAGDDNLGKKDLRVMLCLFGQLDGYLIPSNKTNSDLEKLDPLNFKLIDIDTISDLLGMTKKEVKKSINNIHDLGYIEKGNSKTVKNGYRFSF